jgi:adenylosuccinate synthase
LLSEARRGERKIGTTSRGIGPAYEDKIARRGIRVGDLADPAGLEHNVRANVEARNRLVQDTTMDAADVLADLAKHAARLRPWVRDVSLMLAEAMNKGQSILFEGAQGTLLDIDHGTYPYVTSSNASIGGVCTGLGVPPKSIGAVLGVVKAYTTRVGAGPFPTELTGDMGDILRDSGNEYGSVTGRPRRCGWYDAVAARYGVRINGIDALALTKLDVLDGVETLEICTAYTCGSRTLTEFPSDLSQLAGSTPVYESMPGWKTPTKGVRRYEDLPDAARKYIARLEDVSGVRMAIVSTGSERDDTILRRDVLKEARIDL